MTRRIYVSNIDTPLGFHIAEFFREDHLSVQPTTLIVGTASTPIQHQWIHASINVMSFRVSSKITLNWLAELLLTVI